MAAERKLSSSSTKWIPLFVLAFLVLQLMKFDESISKATHFASVRDGFRLLNISTSKHRGKSFMSSRVLYTSNGTSTFQLSRIILGGDIHTNPGPVHGSEFLSCFYQNVRSLKAVCYDGKFYETKLQLLQDISYGFDLDIICLTETWLNESISDFEILPSGYEIYRKDRQNRTGGGVLIAIKASLSSSQPSFAELPSDLEAVMVEIENLKFNKKILIMVCYRPPNDARFVFHLISALNLIEFKNYHSILVVGDFNFPNIRWIDGSGFSNCSTNDESKLVDILKDLYLFQLIDTPTRLSNVLDLVLTNIPDGVSSLQCGVAIKDIGIPSDHYPIIFDILVSYVFKVPAKRLRYDFKNANFDEINQALHLIPLSSGVTDISSQEDFDAAWEWWNDLVFATINTFVSKVLARNSNHPPWIKGDLAKAIRKKKSLWRKVRVSSDPALSEKFRRKRQNIKMWIRSARKKYLADIANEVHHNSKRFWSYFSFKNKKKSIPDKVHYGTDVFSDDRSRANAFSKYFQSIYKDHDDCSDTMDELAPLNPLAVTLDVIQASVTDVTSLLQSVKITKSIGPDGLPNIILKECAEVLAPSLTAFINFGLSHGFYLSQWKYANLTPVHKKGKRDDVCNYRPISLLPVISKIQEHIVATELTIHVKNQLYNLQHGFQKGKSCVAQLLLVYQEIGKHLDAGHETDLILLDFAKAFDSVCHKRLLLKLKWFGISGPLLAWFESYLSLRLQRVVINGSYSNWNPLKSGVAQGSLLGPTLFLLYINDLPNVIMHSKLALFADDSKCFKAIKDGSSDFLSIQDDLNALSNWSTANEIYFQPLKCLNLRISRKRNSPDRCYHLLGSELKVVQSATDLGIVISSDLKWSDHISSVVAKANRMLGFIKRNCTNDLNKDSLKLLYMSLVRSHLCYASQLWAPQSPTLMIEVENIQRRATRFICKNNELSYKERLLKLNLLPLTYWLEYLDLVFFFKCKAGLIDLNLDNLIEFCSGRSRRGSSGLFLKHNKARTSLFRESYFVRISNLWNAIPDSIRSVDLLASFKKKLKSFFYVRLSNVFNSDDIRSFKLVCPKCRRLNSYSNCTC